MRPLLGRNSSFCYAIPYAGVMDLCAGVCMCRSIEGKSKHSLWLELCELITKHPQEVLAEGIDVEAILRGGIRKYKDEVRAVCRNGSMGLSLPEALPARHRCCPQYC